MNAATTTRLAELREAGASAADAAATLAADPRFANRITADQLRDLFGRTVIGEILQDVADNPAVDIALRYGIRRTLRTLGYENGFIDAQDMQISAELRGAIAALEAAQILTADQVGQVLALAGGPLLEPLNAAEISAHWAALDAAAEQLALRQRAGRAYNAVVAAIDSGETDWAALVALFEAAE